MQLNKVPPTLALAGDGTVFAAGLVRTLSERGCRVTSYADAGLLLSDRYAFSFDFYVVDSALCAIRPEQVVKILRKRTGAGILIWAADWEAQLFDSVIGAGGDMLVPQGVGVRAAALAVMAVYRCAADAQQRVLDGSFDRRGAGRTPGPLVIQAHACIIRS